MEDIKDILFKKLDFTKIGNHYDVLVDTKHMVNIYLLITLLLDNDINFSKNDNTLSFDL